MSLHSEIEALESCIEQLHVIAWRQRMNKDRDAMRGVHWTIQACKRRVEECKRQIAIDDYRPCDGLWLVCAVCFACLLGLEFIFCTL